MIKIKFKLILFVALIFNLQINVQSASYSTPNSSIILRSYLDSYSHTETCLGVTNGNCGGQNSIHPQGQTFLNSYDWYNTNIFLKSRTSITDAGPVYHHVCVSLETLSSTNGVINGSVQVNCSDTQGSTNNLTSLDVGQNMSFGHISCDINYQYFKITTQRTTSSQTVFRVSGGSYGYTYTYRIYFASIEQLGCLPNTYDGNFVPCEIPSKNEYYAGSGYYYIDIDYVPSGGILMVNITPDAEADYYRYIYLNPQIISVFHMPDA